MPLLAHIRRSAPAVDLSIRQQRIATALSELEARAVDIAIAPLDHVPPRFAAIALYEEDFVIVARAGHPFLHEPILARYCAMPHVVVSLADDADTLVDRALEKKRLSRRVMLWVPNFMQALAVIAESDLLGAVPRRMAEMQGKRFGLATVEVPLELPRSRICAVVPKSALMDAGVTWLLETLKRVSARGNRHRRSKGLS
jgi:DNA-binding transcriptional LysR family regulator